MLWRRADNVVRGEDRSCFRLYSPVMALLLVVLVWFVLPVWAMSLVLAVVIAAETKPVVIGRVEPRTKIRVL